MKDQQFEAALSGTDTRIDGIVNKVTIKGYKTAFQFNAIDDTLHLTIGMDEKGHWHRVAGTEPYLTGWTDELAEQIA
ncbi:MAG: hypothetical protein ABI367_15675 [Mucilaginibacter sp.]